MNANVNTKTQVRSRSLSNYPSTTKLTAEEMVVLGMEMGIKCM